MKTTKFKSSEVGSVPQEWDVRPFADSFTLMRNNTYARENLTDLPGQVANVHYGDVLIKYGSVLDFARDEVPYLKPGVKANKDLLHNGDLIFADTAEDETVGKAVEIQRLNGQMAVSGLHTVACRPNENLFAPRYLGYYINSAAYHNQLLPLITGTKVSSVSRAGFASTYVVVPPRAEQEKIAAALSDVDELLAAMTALIEKKRAIKQGAMQELLEVRPTALTQRTQSAQRDAKGFSHGERGEHGEERTYAPRRRLAGFTGAWVERRLGEVCVINPSEDRELPETFTYVDLESVVNGKLIKRNVIRKSCAPSRAQRIFKTGDILFQTVRPYQQNNLFVDFNADAYVASTGYAVVRGTDDWADSGFVYHVMLTERFITQVLDRCTGTSYPAINPRALSDVVIWLPSDVAEQKAIAGVLADMDAEIAAMESKRAKYEQIKRGMMQELLTGKKRILI